MSLHLIGLGQPLLNIARRPIPAEYNDPNLKAICYSAYRGDGPGSPETVPDENIMQDLALLKLAGFNFIRMFGSDVVTHSVLRLIREHYPDDFKMHMTTFLAGDGPINCQTNPINIAQLNKGVELANEYTDIIVAVGVGNETSLAGNLPISCLVQYITYMKARIAQPVTTDDWHTFWKTSACHPVLPLIDFVSLHTYAITDFQYWNWYQLDYDEGRARGIAAMEASFDYTVMEYDETYNNTYLYNGQYVTIGETLPIIIGETGWKYKQTNNYQTDEQYLAKPINEKWFYDKMYEWQQSQTGPKTIIWFEAFNENWKGQDSGWGLWDESRVPLYALCATPAGGNSCSYPDPYAEISYFRQNGIGGSLAFGGLWDNSGQWISLPPSTDWTFSNTANFTIEWWHLQQDFSQGNYPRIFSVGDYPNISIGASITGGELAIWIGNQYSPALTYQFSFGVLIKNWIHMAVERHNGILKLYVNGTSVASVVNSGVSDNSTLPLYIGASQPPGDPYTRFPGNITNFRFVKNEAVYKGNFNVPTFPLTNTGSNTKLLLLSSKSSTAFTDNSSFSKIVTNSTVVPTSWSTFNPFVGGSYLFNGSGQNITVAANNVFNIGTGDYTVEWWQLQQQFGTYFYPRVFVFGSYPNIQLGVTQNANTLQLWHGGQGAPITEIPLDNSIINIWRHFAVQRANNKVTIFINGLIANTINDSTSIVTTGVPLYIGSEAGGGSPYTYFPGYLTNLKIDKKANYVNTSVILLPTSPFQPGPNTVFLAQAFNSGDYLIDSSNNQFQMTTDPQNSVIYSSFSPFGD